MENQLTPIESSNLPPKETLIDLRDRDFDKKDQAERSKLHNQDILEKRYLQEAQGRTSRNG